MREIKFRAWDGVNMVDGQLFSITMKGSLIFDSGSGGEVPAELPLMQYTGLQDKNGQDIYESDLLRCPGGEIHEVIFESYFASFNTKHLASGEVDDITRDGMSDCFEVIGNVHSNPELINPIQERGQ